MCRGQREIERREGTKLYNICIIQTYSKGKISRATGSCICLFFNCISIMLILLLLILSQFFIFYLNLASLSIARHELMAVSQYILLNIYLKDKEIRDDIGRGEITIIITCMSIFFLPLISLLLINIYVRSICQIHQSCINHNYFKPLSLSHAQLAHYFGCCYVLLGFIYFGFEL